MLSEKESIDYANLLGVCMGGSDGKNTELTCDSNKGDKRITINPTDKAIINKIRYDRDGTIHSDDQNIDHDLQETLNLNSKTHFLPQNRYTALKKVYENMRKDFKDAPFTYTQVKKTIKKFESTDKHGKKEEYSGFVLYFLKKRLKQIESMKRTI